MPRGVLRVLAWYIATRGAMLLLLWFIEYVVLMDPRNWLVELDAKGPIAALPEYPWPAALLLELPLRLGVPTILHYFAVVVGFFLAIDAAIVWMLWRSNGARLTPGVWLWLLLVPALGPLVLARFDLLPAFLAAAALIAVHVAPARAGAFAALGAGLKIWPAIVLPALLLVDKRRSRLRVLGAFAACLLAMLVATAWAAGWARVASPFTALRARGLHLEAFAALPLLWARHLREDGARWSVGFSAGCHCHELTGPGTAFAAAASTATALAAAAFVMLLYARAFARPTGSRPAPVGALLVGVSVLAWIATAKVFSPQYLLWAAAPLALAGSLPGGPLRGLEVTLLVAAAALTHLVYPIGYEALIVPGHVLQGSVLAALTLRDALLLVAGVLLAHHAWGLTAPPTPARIE